MTPTRLSLVTYNVWNIQRWPMREAALRGFFQRFRPDIFCLQELRIELRDSLDAALPNYRRVEDPFPGWTRESNIYWNGDLLEALEHGWEDVGISSDPYRGLFWARLRLLDSQRTLLVATAHFTHQENASELATGQSPRAEQAPQTIAALDRLVRPGEAVFFMGDLNDPVIPIRLLTKAGYRSCFARLNLVPAPTWPAMPTARTQPWETITTQTIDWLVSNSRARPLMASVPHYYLEDFAPSDHWPVHAIYELEPES